jgi:hypothetical protein
MEGYVQFPGSDAYYATGLDGEYVIEDTNKNGNLQRPYAIIVDNSMDETDKAKLDSAGAFDGSNNTVIGINLSDLSTLKDAWGAPNGIYAKLFGGQPTEEQYEFTFYGPKQVKSTITVYDESGNIVGTNNDSSQTYVIENIFEKDSVQTFNFKVHDPTNTYQDIDTTISDIHKGAIYVNLVQGDSINVPDSVHYISISGNPGETISFEGDGNSHNFTLILDQNGNADTSLTDQSEELKFNVDANLDEHYSINDTSLESRLGRVNEFDLTLTSWPTYNAIGNTNADSIIFVNSLDSEDTIAVLVSNNGISGGQYIWSEKRPETILAVNAKAMKNNTTNYATETFVLHPDRIEENDIFISEDETYHFHIVGNATKEAQYLIKNSNDTNETIFSFQAGNELIFPGDTNTVNYDVLFDYAESSIDALFEGNKEGYEHLDTNKTIYSGSVEVMDLRLEQTSTGIETKYSKNKISNMYPIPVRDKLTIEFGSSEDEKVQIYDIAGKEIDVSKKYDPFNNKVYINMKNLPNGTYIIKTSDGLSTETTKIIKD